jgi:hypothetical protein
MEVMMTPNDNQGKARGYLPWANRIIREELDYFDIKLMKTMAFCVGVPVGAYFAEWVLPNWWAFILLAILTKIRPWIKAFRIKPKS